MLLQLSGDRVSGCGAVTLGLGVGVGATGPASGSIVPGAAVAVGAVHGQHAVLEWSEHQCGHPGQLGLRRVRRPMINIVECSAPNGVLPTRRDGL